jgi:Putative prokaryotic signal transducing protein
MKRLESAPNLALATLWADLLCQAGIEARVQRAYTSSLAGEIPPDQCLPEIWVLDDGQHRRAGELLADWRRPREQRWSCPDCQELIEGPFAQCWRCGADMPGLPA